GPSRDGPSPGGPSCRGPESATHTGDVPGFVGQGDRGAVRVGVADRVGQGLLDDAVGGQVDARGQLARGAHDLEIDGEPGAAYLVEHAAELAERGRRSR